MWIFLCFEKNFQSILIHQHRHSSVSLELMLKDGFIQHHDQDNYLTYATKIEVDCGDFDLKDVCNNLTELSPPFLEEVIYTKADE